MVVTKFMYNVIVHNRLFLESECEVLENFRGLRSTRTKMCSEVEQALRSEDKENDL